MEGLAIAIAIPFFFLLIGVELLSDKRRRRAGREPLYRFADSITSLACGVGDQVLYVLLIGAIGAAGYSLVYEVRLVTLPESSVYAWILAFLGVDLAYYAYHRASHRINFFWATHVVHHSSEEYNLSTALRQSWFTGLTAWIFYAPLALAGVTTAQFLLCLALNKLYQFWIHTRTIGKLGPLELVMNTPSHHRVHHGIDPEYVDKNYAGVFIVWDRLFGTFTEERAEPAYGTVKPLASFNPLWANLEGFARIVDMGKRTRSVRDKVLAWVAPPEWMPADLGGPVVVPPVDHASRVKYDVEKRRGVGRYVTVQFVGVAVVVVTLLAFSGGIDLAGKAGLTLATLATLVSWGGLFERRPWALPLDLARLLLLGVTLAWIARGGALLAPLLAGWATFAAASAAWALRLRPGTSTSLAPPHGHATERP